MYLLTDLCFLCLGRSKNIKSVLSQEEDDIIIEEKLKSVLSEVVNFRPEIPKNICTDCLKGLNYVYKFKQKCLENLLSLSDYLEKINENMELEHFLSTFNEAQFVKEQQEISANQNGAEDSLKTEQLIDGSPKTFTCETCQNNFDQLNSLKEHLLTHRPAERNIGMRTRQQSYDAEKTTASGSVKQENEEKVVIKIDPDDIHEESEEMVVECEPKDALQNEDNAVSASTNPKPPKPKRDKRRHKCLNCNKDFLSPSHLAVHRRVHTGERPFQCPTCQKTFKRPEHLKNHERIHSGEKSFSCEICGRTFNQHTNLITHKRTHSDVRPYKCTGCDKTFTVNNHLAVHMLSHTGEKPFSCNLCEYKCTTNRDLKLHSRTHTKEKPYSCKSCQQAFTTSSNLQRHIRVNKHYT